MLLKRPGISGRFLFHLPRVFHAVGWIAGLQKAALRCSPNHLHDTPAWYDKCRTATVPAATTRPNAWSCMPKPTPAREPDPMARVVDRLLAQLPGLHGGAEPAPPVFRSSTGEIRVASGRYVEPPTLIGLWGRVALGISLGVMMTAWPYFRECGLPLFGYLGAVAAVVVAGAWIAATAWRLRNGAAHILALVLLLWGLALTADQLLQRTGYAAVPATWQCEAGSGPAWMRWFAPPGVA